MEHLNLIKDYILRTYYLIYKRVPDLIDIKRPVSN